MDSKVNYGLAAVIVAVFAVGGYYFVTSREVQTSLQTGVESVIDFVDQSPSRLQPPSADGDDAAADEPARPSSEGARTPTNGHADENGDARSDTRPPAKRDDTPPAPPAPTGPLTSAVSPPGARRRPAGTATETRASATPTAHYLPGNQSTWMTFDIAAQGPIAIRAAGLISRSDDVSDPDGLAHSAFESTLRRNGRHDRVLPSAPYLALIGRVCSERDCTDPFLIGSDAVICPADLGVSGDLQLNTNNYVRLDGQQTLRAYSSVTGGYSFLTEPAAPAACATNLGSSGTDNGGAGAPELGPGFVLKRDEFRVTSSQTYWKPFFVPLDAPIVIRATGEIGSSPNVPRTSPDGAPLPEKLAQHGLGLHGLYEPSLPYHGLIGRLCDDTGCGRSFLVGRQQTVCPTEPTADHLELWINRVMVPPGMLDRETPLTYAMFELQARDGEYAFEVVGASPDACGAR